MATILLNKYKRSFCLFIFLLLSIQVFVYPAHLKELAISNTLEFNLFEEITILQNGNVSSKILIDIPSSPLADIYRKALAAPNESIEEEVPIPEYDKLTSYIKTFEDIAFLELYNSQQFISVREKFYEALSNEQEYSLGLKTVILDSKMVPLGSSNEIRIYANACAFPEKLQIIQYSINDVWIFYIGPTNSTNFATYFLTKIIFSQLMLETLQGYQTYKSCSLIKINLPANATFLNYNEIASLRWFVDLGGGTYTEASLSIENGTVVLKETTIVASNPITITPTELCEAFSDYKLFSIKYSLPKITNINSIKEIGKIDDDFSWSWNIELWEATATKNVIINDFKAELTAYSKLEVNGFVGWEPTVPIPYLHPLEWFEAWIKPQATVKVTIKAEVSAEFSYECEWKLFEKKTTFVVWIGPVPVLVDVDFSVMAKLEVSFEGKLIVETGAKAYGWLKAGVRWNEETGWQQISEHDLKVDYTEPSIEFQAEANIKPSLIPRIDVLFYEIAGPFVEFVLYAQGSVIIVDSAIEFCIKIGLDVNGGVKFEEHLKKLLRLNDYSWTLLSVVFKEFVWKMRHDVAITYVYASKTKVYPGESIEIYVYVENEGNFYEEFNVILSYENNLVEQEYVKLGSGDSKTLKLIWDTNGVCVGKYTIKAEASVVTSEDDVEDNTYTIIIEILPVDFQITFTPKKPWYRPGELTETQVQVKNLRNIRTTFWLGARFRDSAGEFEKYDSQITIIPFSATLDPSQTANFTITWTIPSNAPIGYYQIDLNCWKEQTLTEKYLDNLEWSKIFYVYGLNILMPTITKPAIAGDPANPNEILISVSWIPQADLDPFVVDLPTFIVEVDHKPCSIKSIDIFISYLGIYSLRVTPPTMPIEGLYDLNVTVEFDQLIDFDMEPKSIKYTMALPVEPIEKGLAWLRTTQYGDGSWRSSVGVTALCVLAFLNAGYDETDTTVSKAIDYILANVKPDGSIYITHPTYETSLAMLPLIATRNDAYKTIIENAKNWLVNSQWDENCLWGSVTKDDWYYGGFGYGWDTRPDLSNTQFALLALDAAGLPKNDPTWVKAQVFLHRCQNVNFAITLNIEGVEYTVQPYNHYGGYDGGFIYYPGASLAGGQTSYGSMTGAGIWGLLLSGISKTDQRMIAAMNWVKNHYTWDTNPGIGWWRMYYYYLSMSKALTMYGEPLIDGHDWYQELYNKIVEMQIDAGVGQGYWSTSNEDYVPDLTTAYAILSLQTRTIAPPVQRLSYLTFILRSNCYIRLIDPNGNLVGYNYITGLGENQIPTAVYSGPFMEPQYIVIINPQAGTYRLELIGISEGPFKLTIQGSYGEEVMDVFEYIGEIKPAELYGCDVTVTAIVGPIDVYANPPELQPKIYATIDVCPDVLNLKGKGQWVTVYIELPEGYNISDINIATILLNDTIPVDPTTPYEIGDYDNDGIPDLMVKFNRTAVSEFIMSRGIKFGNVTLTITGMLIDATRFEGSDIIKVKMPGDINMDGKVDMTDIAIACRAFGSYEGSLRWNLAADENEDNKVDLKDICLISKNFGKTYT